MHSDRDLLRWSEALSGIARTGLGFTQNLYERERFEEVLAVAAEIRSVVGSERTPDSIVDEWMKHVGEGVSGYQTPKATVGAIVTNDLGELLLVQRRDAGVWLYPTGWADVGYSASEVAVKEVPGHILRGDVCRVVLVIDFEEGKTATPQALLNPQATAKCRTRSIPDLRQMPIAAAESAWIRTANEMPRVRAQL